MADGPRVAGFGVARSAWNELGIWASRGHRQAGGPEGGNRKASATAAAESGGSPGLENVHHRIEIVYLKCARNIRATNAELPGRSQRVRNRARGPDREQGPIAGRRR
jgi:hypothetical protein